MIKFSGIRIKLFGWFFIFVMIFFSTVLILYLNVHEMMKLSEIIVNKNYKISSASKKLLESILSMEENEKKYVLLKKEDYLTYFLSAQKQFEDSLNEILKIEKKGLSISKHWKELYQAFQKSQHGYNINAYQDATEIWISEETINRWINLISTARSENEMEVEQTNRELNHRGALTVRAGLAGLFVSILVGLTGWMILSHAMIRPLGELQKAIRSISHDHPIDPVQINSKDEFEELALAFNEMALRLREEQRMRSDFISMLSHEIRTPLTSIRESINLISEGIMGQINERQKKFLEIANYEMGRVSNLLNRMMQVSFMESGELKIQPQPIDVLSFITDCVDKIKPTAESKSIEIDVHIHEQVPNILGDLEYLKQVFINIIGNAIKFCPSGSKITIATESNLHDGKLCFIIKDNGPGIPEEEQPYVFNKYYRARNVRNHLDGAGLGLSIARHIVEAHGGNIWMISKEGDGTTFMFTIPLAEPHSRDLRKNPLIM